ncbi:hypothetical protein ACWEKT_12120 [Nocardia takedensis]
MDRPDMGVRPGRAEDWARWMDDAPTEPLHLPRFDPAPDPRPAPDPTPLGEPDAFSRLIDRSGRRRGAPRWLVPLAGSVAAAVLLAVALLQFRGGPAPQSVASATPTEIVIVPASAAGNPVPARCPAERVGDRIQGNGAGNLDSGPAAIFAFQYAYYVARSGTLARTAVSDQAAVSAAPAIQQGIDTIPAGTTHCVSMTPGAVTGQYLVTVTEYRPGTAAFTYNTQAVSTARVGDRTLITGIAPAP